MLQAMAFAGERSQRPILIVLGLAIALVVLAILQYRWIGQISESDRERMQASLETSVRQFRGEFNRELLALGAAFRPDFRAATTGDWSSYAGRWEYWKQTAPYPGLLREIFIWQTPPGEKSHLLELNPESEQFVPVDWPSRFDAVKAAVASRAGRRRPFRIAFNRPFVIESVPAVMFPLRPAPRRRNRPPPRVPNAYLMLELDREFMQKEFFPELAARHFARPDGFLYHVAIFGPGEAGSKRILYRSDPELQEESFESADVRTNLLWNARDFFPAAEDGMPPGPERRGRFSPPGFGRDPERAGGGPWRGPRGAGAALLSDSEGWVLAVKHPQGSLDAAVQSLRTRNLAVSFGILVLLAVSMGMILVSTQRAQRLAKLQMDFVAGVSHELKTPLAVIRSAAENLADGVVDSQQKIRDYGALIRREGRRLSTMIEQTLQFAAAQAKRRTYDLRPLAPGPVIDKALEEAAPAIEEAGFRVEKHLEPDLPDVETDENALRQILQNLINNALKYGGGAKWLAVRAFSARNGAGSEVSIAVEDRGAGISGEDLAHIFEPFYRGKAAKEAQIQGAGLGLSLARETAQAMGGALTVKSVPGEGSAFTLHLPVAGSKRLDSGSSGEA